MGTVLPFFIDAGFDPEATTVMGDAFERACKQLHDRGQPEIVREVIARRIIAAAKAGQRDPELLCNVAHRSFGLTR